MLAVTHAHVNSRLSVAVITVDVQGWFDDTVVSLWQ